MRRPVADADEDEIETRDGVHGLTVWAAGTLIAAVLALGGIGGLMRAAGSVTGTAAGGAAELVEDQGDYFASLILRDEAGTSPSPEARSEVGTILLVNIRWEPRSGGLDAGCGGGPVPGEQFRQA